MRSILLIVTLALFTMYAENGIVLWSCYYLDADAIAAAYCVNPTNPCCHGRCHISKLVNRQQHGSTPNAAVETIKPAPLFLTAVTLPRTDEEITTGIEHGPASLRPGYAAAIDHPPPFLA